MMGAPFLNCSGSAIDIQDIVCKNGTKDPAPEAFKMWWYDTENTKYVYATYTNDAWADDGEDGGAGTEYDDQFYWTTDDEDYFILAPLGWKHDADAPATIVDHGKSFQPGEGYWIQGGVNTPIVTVAGKVVNPGDSEEFATVALTKSIKQMVTNPFPVGGYDIQDVSCKNGTKDPAPEAFKMWWYDTENTKYVYATYTNDAWADDGEDGGAGTEYDDQFYWTTDDEDYFILAPLGWKHDADAPATIVDHGKTFVAGESFWVQGGVNTPIVRFKNPFYKAN